jgi:hypothetical protein
VRAQQFNDGRTPGEVEQLLVHRIEKPTQGGYDEDEPVTPVQLFIPGYIRRRH